MAFTPSGRSRRIVRYRSGSCWNGRMERFNNDLVIRYLDKVVVKDDGYEVVFKAGVTVEVEV